MREKKEKLKEERMLKLKEAREEIVICVKLWLECLVQWSRHKLKSSARKVFLALL